MNKLISKYLFYYPITIIRGELIGKYLSQYSSMQWKSQDEIIAYQNESLRKLLLHAYKTVPYYHRLIDESGINLKSTASIEQLSFYRASTILLK